MATRILVVEDEPDIARLVKLTLELNGDLSVELATSGAEALERVAAEVPALIVLDLNLPVLSTTLSGSNDSYDRSNISYLY